MLDETYFRKKFSVGLAMDTTKGQFEEFLKKYNYFIENIYISPPLGDHFHGREYIREQFHASDKVDLFWKLVRLINRYQVSLEVVLNTEILQIEDFIKTKKEFAKRGIVIDKFAVFDRYYKDVKTIFPEAKIIKTVNEMPNEIAGFRKIDYKYNEIVVGRQFIRNRELLRIIKDQLNALPVLLLNNGCSFHCGGCQDIKHCKNAYERERKKKNAEYLYALQSILPYELHEGYIDVSNVSLLKLSTRNADTDYTARCLESYIKNNAEQLVKERTFNYLLWARLGWHIEHFEEFDFKRILKIKESIYATL